MKELLLRNGIFTTFFEAEGARLAEACHEMSRRFLSGGRLLTVGIVGCDGGKIVGERLADYAVVVRSDYTPRVQVVQASIYHTLRGLIESVKAVEGQERIG